MSPDPITLLKPMLSEERTERIETVISHRIKGLTVLLEQPYDHGNIVAIMRTCETFGVHDVHIVERDGAFKQAKKVGQGADKWLNIEVHQTPQNAAAKLKSAGYQLLAADLTATRPLSEFDLTGRVALVFGTEKEGISETLRTLCDDSYAIPMVGFTQSLNLSCAAAISLHTASQVYRSHLAGDSDLTEEQAAEVRAFFYRRSVRYSEVLLNEPVLDDLA